MFIHNIDDLIKEKILSTDDFYFFNKSYSKELFKKGFNPISKNKDSYIFLKTEELEKYIKQKAGD